jgi:hypothetical protein
MSVWWMCGINAPIGGFLIHLPFVDYMMMNDGLVTLLPMGGFLWLLLLKVGPLPDVAVIIM